jgi:hypothetical protein
VAERTSCASVFKLTVYFEARALFQVFAFQDQTDLLDAADHQSSQLLLICDGHFDAQGWTSHALSAGQNTLERECTVSVSVVLTVRECCLTAQTCGRAIVREPNATVL